MGYKTIITTFFFFLSIFLSIFVQSVSASWWNDSWKYRKQLTFQNSAQNENLSNFPVLVKLTSSNFDFSKAQSTGYDIRFLDTDDNSELPYEIEKWDTSAQEAYVWVKVPQIDASSNSDYMYMYYGNSVAVNAQSTINVWDSDFKQVLHFNQLLGAYLDSTNNGNNSTLVSVTNRSLNGSIGLSPQFNGVSDLIQFNPVFPAQQSNFTVEAWIKTSSSVSTKNVWGQGRENASGCREFIEIKTHQMHGGINTGGSRISGDNTIDDNSWYYIAIAYKNTPLLSSYVNGIQQTQTATTTNTNTNVATNSTLGRNCWSGYGQFLDGQIDEVRVSTTTRSANWIAASYKSQNNTFISYNSEDTYVHSTANTQYVAQSSTEKPTCTNSAPAAPDLFQINTTKNSATLYFTPAGNPHNSYTISYGYDDDVERFGTGFSKMSSEGVQSYTINALSPSTKYFFKIRAGNGCMPGPWSRIMNVKTNAAYSNIGFIYYAYSTVVKTINNLLQ